MIRDREAARQEDSKVSNGDSPPVLAMSKRRALMDFLLDMKQKGDFSSQEVREQVDTFMFEVSRMICLKLIVLPFCQSLIRVTTQQQLASNGPAMCSADIPKFSPEFKKKLIPS